MSFLYIGDQRYNNTALITGNSSAEIFAAIENGTFLYVDDQRYNITDENITIGKQLSFAFGEFIDNLIDGMIGIVGNVNVTGSLNVSGNVSGDWFIGNVNWSDIQNKELGNTSLEIWAVVDNQSFNNGEQVVYWDGKDADGNICPTGIYIVKIEGEGKSVFKTVAVLNK